MSEKIRLNKFISDSGVCSRREADKYIETGHVTINGRRAKIGDMVSPAFDKVLLSGNPVEARDAESFVLMAFNKPVGLVSTTEIGAKDSVVSYIGFHERIFPIGRLDKDSQGLLLLTNNGNIVNKILRAGNQHEKEYVVTVDKPITEEFIQRMGSGVPILGEVTKKCKVSKETTNIFRITLIQGLNRQIRRMCEFFGYEVVKLERVRIMNVTLKGLPVGEWRLLEDKEIAQIMEAIADSSSDDLKMQTTKESKRPNALKNEQPKSSGTTFDKAAKTNTRSNKKAEKQPHVNPKSRELRDKQSGAGAKGKSFGGSRNTSSRNKGRR